MRPLEAADVVRWALLACWAFALIYAAVLGDRSAPLRQLELSLDSGQVHTVAVTRGFNPDSSGYATQELHWREGWHRYRAEVVMVSPDGSSAPARDEGVAIRRGFDIASELVRHNPQVDVVRVPFQRSGGELYGWQVPLWLGAFWLCVNLCMLVVLVMGPQPWRANRWAWFWLMTNPLGAALFLLLAGPTPPLPAPPVPARRLSGGWAFLLTLVLASFLPHW